jgi:ATP adenylyltransferase
METERLVGVPSVGPLVPGWLLALPREHRLNFAEAMDRSAGIDLELTRLAERWEALFGPLTWFEHGPKVPGSDVGCSIDHAHMHLVPLGDLNLLHAARDQLDGIHFSPVESLSEVRDAITRDCSYLYIRLPDGTQWLAASNSIPSQSLRRVIASEQGCAEEWDWKRYSGPDLLSETIAQASLLR